MSDDFQRDALAPLMCPRHDCESTRHALNQLRVENKHLRAEIERLQRERDELQQSFDLHWRASMRAIKRWQEAHPGSDLTWPDHADLVVWLLEQLDAASGVIPGGDEPDDDGPCPDPAGHVRRLGVQRVP